MSVIDRRHNKNAVCPRCNWEQPGVAVGVPGEHKCRYCGTVFEESIFPAVLNEFSPVAVQDAEIGSGEARCYFHDGRVAAVVCDGCGVYLCPLCDLNIADGHYCSNCLTKIKNESTDLLNRVLFVDTLLLWFSVLSTMIIYLTFIFDIAIIIMCFRFWGTVRQPYKKRGNWRFLLAGTISAVKILAFISLVLGFIYG